MLTPEQHEELGHQLKLVNPTLAIQHYNLARMIRNKLAIAAGRTH